MKHKPAIVVHGGAGAKKQDEDGCRMAAHAGLALLLNSGSALDADVAAVAVLEDDPRFNAGTGSVLCMDGLTVEMDASVMDSRGQLGAVAALRQVRNPVHVARAVCDTPHHLLCGEGALQFARLLGHAEYDPTTEAARARFREMKAQLRGSEPLLPGVDNAVFARFWNYPGMAAPGVAAPATPGKTIPASPSKGACDTVGAVVRDSDGHFAVAASTGGSAPALLGRVGDTPLIGCGFYAGHAGAVAATGIGEHILRHMLAHTVHQWLAGGMPLAAALRRGIGLFPQNVDVGLIAVTRSEAGSDRNRNMPTAQLSASSRTTY